MKVDKILVPLDGSKLAEAALLAALDLLKANPAGTLVLVRAAEAGALAGTDPVEAQVAVVHEAEAYLDSVAKRLAQQGFTAVQTSVWYGTPATSIIEAAQVGHVDLIVMSTHGRSGLGRLILGSVAESVLRGTRMPILLVRDWAPVDVPADARQEAVHHV